MQKLVPLVVKMTRFSTAHFGKFLKLREGQHGEQWLGHLFRKSV